MCPLLLRILQIGEYFIQYLMANAFLALTPLLQY